jgi:putative transcriptional regulator
MAIVQRTRVDLDLAKVDWAGLAEVSDADIDAAVANDPDLAPIFSDDELARARRILPPPTPDDVRAIRQRLGLSQKQFAGRYGFSVETIRNYEQGHRRPTGPARVLLRVIAGEPDAVTRALSR